MNSPKRKGSVTCWLQAAGIEDWQVPEGHGRGKDQVRTVTPE